MNTTTEIPIPTLSVDLIRSARRSDAPCSSYTDEELAQAVDRYRKFLCLAARYPDVPITPSKDIDEMWHLHMLSPRAYYEDCQAIFGDILDHDGGFGKEADEEPVLLQLFEETSTLWKKEFDEPYVPFTEVAGCKKVCRVGPSKCSTKCKAK